MTPAAIEKYALSLPGAELSIKWGDHRTFVVGGKMFAMLSGPEGPKELSFKCSDLAFEMLIQEDGIMPAPYMQRMKWVRLEILQALSDAEIRARLKEAHALFAAKLPKKVRADLGV
ncbi:MAG: MmcQ/YjbR family DNA-binding protein [Alphaproteobacteria bacterium]|nr:MmcQ/YjbR family DNA-binding protein [Alphaproteobacteria bacterium]